MRIALLHEHPAWSIDLMHRMTERGVDVTPIDVSTINPRFPDPAVDRFDLWVNRVNAMPSAGRPNSVVAGTGHLLLSLEASTQKVFNGHRSFVFGGSKAAQTSLFAAAGVLAPPSIGILSPSDAVEAAGRLGYPVLTKPNIGGSGHGIGRYNSPDELEAAVDDGAVDLGVDGTGLVQKVIASADGLVHRIEVLGTELFYATDQVIQEGTFNYCAVDGCSIDGEPTRRIDLVEPRNAMLDAAIAIVGQAGADIGGIEYLINDDDGQPYVYDFNPYSNFVVGFDDDLGFNPVDRYIDAVLAKAGS